MLLRCVRLACSCTADHAPLHTRIAQLRPGSHLAESALTVGTPGPATGRCPFRWPPTYPVGLVTRWVWGPPACPAAARRAAAAQDHTMRQPLVEVRPVRTACGPLVWQEPRAPQPPSPAWQALQPPSLPAPISHTPHPPPMAGQVRESVVGPAVAQRPSSGEQERV